MMLTHRHRRSDYGRKDLKQESTFYTTHLLADSFQERGGHQNSFTEWKQMMIFFYSDAGRCIDLFMDKGAGPKVCTLIGREYSALCPHMRSDVIDQN